MKRGKLRSLGVTSGKRTPLAPDVPAIAEVLSGYELIAWVRLGRARGTPKAWRGRTTPQPEASPGPP